MKKLKFIFKEGKVIADAQGFTGKECIDTADKILEVLNAEVEKRRLKPEYYREKVAAHEYETTP